MNYIYDIMVNFKYPLYDFYDWNKNDNIENIKRIPLYKVGYSDLDIFKYNKVKLLNIDMIKKNTKIFNNKKKTYNAIVLTDGKEAYAFNFDDNGICCAKSSILLDEEMEIIKNSSIIPEDKIEFEIISKDKNNVYMTRLQKKIVGFLISQISNMNDNDKINYLYYECFDNYVNIEKKEFIDIIKREWNDKYYKIYDFLNSISMNKK